MSYTRTVSFVAAAAMFLVPAIAPLAAAGPKDDKKPAQTLSSPADQEYKLGAGDKLRIEVYKDPQLSQSVQVRPDGKVTLPLIGDTTAAGLTSIELRDQIAT